MTDNFIITQAKDDKVKLNSSDPTSGYLIEKIDEGVFNNFDVTSLSALDAGITTLGVVELTANSGTLTASRPFVLKQTWNNVSNPFNSVIIDVTDSGSSTSTLLDIRKDNISKFKVNKGSATTSTFTMGSNGGDFLVSVGGNTATFGSGSNHDISINRFTVGRQNGTIGDVITSLQTWSNSATTFTGFKMNVTDTASSSSSLLMDLQVGSVSKFYIDKTGQIICAGGLQTTTGNLIPAGGIIFNRSNQDIQLLRDSAGTLAQRNSTNPQEFRLYGTYTSATNYERLSLSSSATEFAIKTEKGSAGGTARPLKFYTDGTERMSIGETGTITGTGWSLNTVRFSHTTIEASVSFRLTPTAVVQWYSTDYSQFLGFSKTTDNKILLKNITTGIPTDLHLSSLSASGSISTGYVAKTANYVISATDYTIDCTANSFTLTLPTAVGATGRLYVIKNSGGGTITVACNGAETIDGGITASLTQPYESITLQSTGLNWILI